MGDVCFELNGEKVIVTDESPQLNLLTWLRNSGRTGTKEGCAEGECGACAVALLSRDSSGRAYYQSINSCLLPLGALHGRKLLSVEGLSPRAGGTHLPLHPVQEKLAESGGSQCGYCTPGFVVSLFCEYYRPGRTHYDSEAISGNLCRCTGYRPIIDTAKSLPVPPPPDSFSNQLQASSQLAPGALPQLNYTAQGQRYVRPQSLSELLRVLNDEPEAQLIAGGTDLMVAANLRGQAYALLVDGAGVGELQQYAQHAGQLVLGAGLTFSHLQQQLGWKPSGAMSQTNGSQTAVFQSALSQMLPLFASRLIRNRATLGGNLANASPIGDLSPVLLALNATVVLASLQGETLVPMAEWGCGFRKTRLLPGQLILQITIPLPWAKYQRFYKVSRRPLDDISTVSAAFALELGEGQRVIGLSIAYGGIADRALLVSGLDSLAVGCVWDQTLCRALIAHVQGLGTPLSDHRGSAQYRRALLGELVERFFDDIAPDIVANNAGDPEETT